MSDKFGRLTAPGATLEVGLGDAGGVIAIRIHQARWHRVDTMAGTPSKHDCELTPDVHLHFTGCEPVETGVPDDGEPALMQRLIDLTLRKRMTRKQ